MVVVGATVDVVDVVEVVVAFVVDVEGSVVSTTRWVDEVGSVVTAGVASDVDEHATVTHASALMDSTTRMRCRSRPHAGG